MGLAFIFPGQGSQFVGMGIELAKNFSVAREVFQEVDSSLNQSLYKIIVEGPDSALMLTENTQPALMAVSLAFMRVLDQEVGYPVIRKADFLAGHSLGEYTALTVAGVFSLADSAKLLKIRGQAMQSAVPVGIGAMAALLGADLAIAQAICNQAVKEEKGGICTPANDNCPGQVVISGLKTTVDKALELAPKHGIKKAILLPVSAPFHCALMQSAADRMAEALKSVTFKKPSKPIIANINAKPVSDPSKIQLLLVEQVVGMVKWRESVLTMKENNVNQFIEVGAGKVLSGLIKRIDKDLTTMNCTDIADIGQITQWLLQQ